MIAAVGCAAVATLIGWLLRPKLGPRAAAPSSPHRRVRWIAAVAVAVVVAPLLGLVALIAVASWRHWSKLQSMARTTRSMSAHFPDALDLLVLSIRAGYLPAQAIVEIIPFLPTPLRPAFTAVDDAMQRGDRFADALFVLQAHIGSVARPLVDSLSAADRYGLPLAPVLERLAFEARQQRRRDADAAAREVPVRLAMPLVMCTLPSFVLLAIVPLLLGALSSLRT